MSQGLVIYSAGSPFLRTRRAEYRYPPVSVEAEEPPAPLLDPFHGSQAVLLVADIYSVWPGPGGYRAASYREMLDMLESHLERSCSRRLPASHCSRVRYRAYPWRGRMAGWVFDAQPGDATLYHMLHTVEAVQEALRQPPGARPRRVYTVYAEEQHPWPARLQELAAAAAALALEAELVEAVQEPHPYPRGRSPPLVDTVEHRRLPPSAAAARLLAEAEMRALLEPRRPHAPRPPRRLEQQAARLARVVEHARRCRLEALAEAAAATPSPLAEAAAALRSAARLYEEATAMVKQRQGGRVAHGLAASHQAAVTLAAAAALLHVARRAGGTEKAAQLLGCH